MIFTMSRWFMDVRSNQPSRQLFEPVRKQVALDLCIGMMDTTHIRIRRVYRMYWTWKGIRYTQAVSFLLDFATDRGCRTSRIIIVLYKYTGANTEYTSNQLHTVRGCALVQAVGNEAMWQCNATAPSGKEA